MEKVFLWGTGFIAQQIVKQEDIFYQYDILGFIDNNIDKAGTFFFGKEIFSPCILNKIQPDRIVVLTDSYMEIEKQIAREYPLLSGIVEDKNYFYKQMIFKRYEDSCDLEIVQILKYLQKNNLQVFNYDFVQKYRELEIEVHFDTKCKMYFVYHKNKILYFPQYLDTERKVREYYRNLLIEQDKKSPHRYLDDKFNIRKGDIVVDIGAAEGIFALDIIEKVSKLYLVEADKRWIEALQETFKDHLDKIVIIKKYVTSINQGKFMTLDSMIDEPVNFIKMDIEGNEWDALLGAGELINRSMDLKCAVCVYHGDFDEILVKDVLKKYEMRCSTTRGYMWFPDKIRQTYVSTRLCRGIVRAVKEAEVKYETEI